MEIRAGYEIAFTVRQRTAMILMLNVHPSRRRDLVTEDSLIVTTGAPLRPYRDTFGNICNHTPSLQKADVGRETVMHLVAMGKGVSLTSEVTVATTFPEIIFPSDFRR